MTRPSKILTVIGVALAALAVVMTIFIVFIVPSASFQNYVRGKIISAAEESTGGRVDIQTFRFDVRNLTATITNFVVHGTEPPGAAPLLQVPEIALRIKLFQTHLIDLESLTAERPAVNLIVHPDGTTNIPPRKTQGSSGLKTAVDLAIGRIDLNDGAIHALDQSIPLNVHGDRLRIALVFENARYSGSLSMAPIEIASSTGARLRANLQVPLEIGANSVAIRGATLSTPHSHIALNCDVWNLAAPDASIEAATDVNLPEIATVFPLPLRFHNAPDTLRAHGLVRIQGSAVDLQNASASLGATSVEARGNLNRGAAWSGSADLGQISSLLALPEDVSGTARLSGTLREPLDVTGDVRSNGLSLTIRGTRFHDLDFRSAFHFTPGAFELTGFDLQALGGGVSGDLQFHSGAPLRLAARLRDFDLRTLTARFASPKLDYTGTISGEIDAAADPARLLRSLTAGARISIAPKPSGIPVSGVLDLHYWGDREQLALSNSQIQLPHSAITLSGTAGSSAQLRITSRNLADFASLPVHLRNGAASIVVDESGPLRDPHITGTVRATNFTVSTSRFDELSAAFRASPSGISIDHGVLHAGNEAARFTGRIGLDHWIPSSRSPLTASGEIRHGDVAGLLALAGESKLNATGTVDATIDVTGTLASPTGGAQLSIVHGEILNAPFDRIQGAADFTGQTATLRDFEILAPSGRIDAQATYSQGVLQASASSASLSLSQLPLRQFAIDGTANFRATIVGHLRGQTFDLTALNASAMADTKKYGSLTAQAVTYGTEVDTRIDSTIAGSVTHAALRTNLSAPYASEGSAVIDHLHLERLIPSNASGQLSASVKFSGTIASPSVNANVELVRANLYGQPLNSVRASIEDTPTRLTVDSLRIESPAGNVELRATYDHAFSNLRLGRAELHISTPGIQLSRVAIVNQREPGLTGTFEIQGDAAVDVGQTILPVRADVTGGLKNVALDGKPIGNLTFQSRTAAQNRGGGNTVAMQIDSDLAQSSVHGNLEIALRGDYPATGSLRFNNVRLAAVRPFFPSIPATLHLVADGDTSGSIPLTNPGAAQGRLRFTRLEVSEEHSLTLRNDGALTLAFGHAGVQIENARFEGPSTHVAIDGSAGLTRSAPLDLTLSANTDASIVKLFHPAAFTAGSAETSAKIRGTLANPAVAGQVRIHDFSLQFDSWPTGISHANGVIQLNGSDARIVSFTAEAGGGKVTATGMAAFSSDTLSLDLHAAAHGVRARYSGASVSANANVTLTGTSQRSVLGGTVTITRVGYNQQSDIGSILTASSAPPAIPATSTGMLARMRLNVRIQTAPDVVFQTNLAQQLSANADLTLEGTAATPGMVGRVNVTGGTLIFFGNKYTVNRGSISFYNPVAIDPVLDVDLETFAQGVQVDIGVSGPIEDLKLSYRSDPPLRFEDIVALLAAGKTPPDPTVAVNQPYTPSQTATQMGESAVLGAAVANPVASRLARVFGVNQISIAPSFVSGSVLPQARVTVQEEVSTTVTFTYSQDLSQANSQLIRIEWALTPRFSAIATRDENGIFGLDFYYKLQFK